MRAWDYELVVPHRPGSVATLAEELGKAGVNIEGISAVEYRGHGIIHVLVVDNVGARKVFEKFASVGFQIRNENQVVVEQIADAPGVLGERAREVADQNINLTTLYLATNTRLVMGCDDINKLEEAWATVTATGRANPRRTQNTRVADTAKIRLVADHESDA